MARRKGGRPRKPAVARHKCGKIERAHRTAEPHPTDAVRAQRIARGATAQNWKDQRWGSELGRLYIAGQITKAMFDAGEELASLAGAYFAVGGFGSPTPRAADLDRVKSYSEKLGDPDEWRDLKWDYDEAVSLVKTITVGLCVMDWPADAAMVRDDLAKLAKRWHLDEIRECA